MKKVSLLALAAVALLGLGQLWADEDGKCPGKCAETCDSTCAGDCEGCPVTKAMAALPKMTFTVAEESTCCEQQASELAKAHNAPIHFVVAEKTYDDKAAAMVALADATEKFVADFAEPKTCSVSGKTSVCGTSTGCCESAKEMAAIAKAAMDEVHMSYKVGDETCQCPNAAAAMAKSSGAKTSYVVEGEETCCQVDARIKMAVAKYRAAVMAIAKASQDAATASATSQS